MSLSYITKRIPKAIDKHIIGFDTETFLIPETGEIPKLVCGTFSLPDVEAVALIDGKHIKIEEQHVSATLILNAEETAEKMRNILAEKDCIIAIHNAKFDLMVLLKQDYSLLMPIVKALKDGRIICTAVVQAMLNACLPSRHDADQVSLLESIKDFLPYEKYQEMHRLKNASKIKKEKTGDLFTAPTKAIRTGYGDLAGIPIDQWGVEEIVYAKEDALLVKALLFIQWKKSIWLDTNRKGLHFIEDAARQTYADFVLAFASTYTGIRLDRDTHMLASQQLKIKEEELARQLVEMGCLEKTKTGYKKNMTGLKNLFISVYDRLGIAEADRKKTDGGSISTDAEATENLVFLMEKQGNNSEFSTHIKMLELLDQYEDAKKQQGTYLDNFEKAYACDDHRLRYSFKGYGAGTGRTSSSNPNLQNLPRGGIVRNVIKASEGHILGLCDYSNAEMRTLSQIHIDEGRESILAQRYREDAHFDPHLFVSAQFCGVTYEQALEYYADKKHALYKDLKEKRNLAKVLNFGLAGGLGATSFISYAKGYGFKGDSILKLSQVDDAIRDWMKVYPEMKMYFAHRRMNVPNEMSMHKKQDWKDGEFKAVYKYPRSNRFRFCRSYTNACNSPFQGMASDGAKNALIMVFEECLFDTSSPLFGCRIVCFIHDEIIIEIPVNDIDDQHYTQQGKDAVDRLSELMKEGMEIMTPDIPAVCETTLSYRWDKEAYSPIQGDRQQVYVSKIDKKDK